MIENHKRIIKCIKNNANGYTNWFRFQIGFFMCSVQKSRFIWSQKKFHGRKRRKFRKHRKDQQLCRDATAKGTVQPYEKDDHHIIRWSFFLFGGATARKSWGSHLWCRGKVPENREKPSISTRLSVCSRV